MKHLLLITTFVLISTMVSAKSLYGATWKSPFVLFNNSECVNVEKVKFGRERTEINVSILSGKFVNIKGCYITDNLQNKYECIGTDTLGFIDSGKRVRLAFYYEKCEQDVLALDIKNLFANQQIRIEGIMKSKSSPYTANTDNVSIPDKVLTSDTSVIKGHIDAWDPYRGYGFVYAYNDYSTPSTYYSRIDNEGNFELKVQSLEAKLLYLEMPFLGNSCRVPIIAVPGDTLDVAMQKDNAATYHAVYNYDKCKSNIVSEHFLYLLHDYPIYSPYVMLKYLSAEDYEKTIRDCHENEHAVADYYKWKYNLSDREVMMLKRSSDINFLTNILYKEKIVQYSPSSKINISDDIKTECLNIINDKECKGLPSYDRLRSIVYEIWNEKASITAEYSADDISSDFPRTSVFHKLPHLKDSLEPSNFYQFVFVDSTQKCIETLSKMDNLIYDFKNSNQLRFVFVTCDSLYRCKDVNSVLNHFLKDQVVINLSLNAYYTLNECLGNTLNSYRSKTVDSKGFILQHSFQVLDETWFRRNLRYELNKIQNHISHEKGY